MGSISEQADYFAAVLWCTPMTPAEMRKHEAFKNRSVDAIIMLLERLDRVYTKGERYHVSQKVALRLGDSVSVRVEVNCRKCKGTGITPSHSVLGTANWPCEKCSGDGKKILRE